MPKDTKKNQQKGGQTKAKNVPKLPEVEDFFTNFLSKKVRNINKKISHIDELQKKQKTGEIKEFKKDQEDMIHRKPEHLHEIEKLNNIKEIYLEAYNKKAENEPAKDNQVDENKGETKVEIKEVIKEVPVEVDVSGIKAESENKGVVKACEAISKLFLASHLLRSEAFCSQFAQISNIEELETLSAFVGELMVEEGDNCNQTIKIQNRLAEYVNGVDVRGTDSKSLPQIAGLVDSINSSEVYATFVPKVPEPEVAPEPVVVKEEVPEPAQQEVRKDSEDVAEKQNRKDSEAQQDLFMQEDDSDDEDADSPAEKPIEEQKAVEKTAEKQPLQEKSKNGAHGENVQKEEPKKQVEDSDEEEWHNTSSRPKPYEQRGEFRGGRGNRGRGGRGNYRGGKPRDGERRDGETRDGERGDRRGGRGGRGGNKDGENNYRGRGDRENRGGRGRGGRGRGGYNKEGGVLRRGTENEKPADGEAKPLKEVGTMDSQPKQAEAAQE